jgi:hypothetical protein
MVFSFVSSNGVQKRIISRYQMNRESSNEEFAIQSTLVLQLICRDCRQAYDINHSNLPQAQHPYTTLKPCIGAAGGMTLENSQ